MPRYIGYTPSFSNLTVTSAGGVYSLNQQRVYKDSGYWIADPYSVSFDQTLLNETGNTGLSFAFTTNLSNSGLIYWTILSTSGTVNSSDFTTPISGYISAPSGLQILPTIYVTVLADSVTEGTETFALQLRSGGPSGDIVYTSGNVSITDTSFDIGGGGNTVNITTYYKTHVFTSPGTFTLGTQPLGGTVEYLAVGPGGRGGYSYSSTTGGFAGSGGVKNGNIALTLGSYTVTVGTSAGSSSSIVGNNISAYGYSGGNGGDAQGNSGQGGAGGGSGGSGPQTPGPAAYGGPGGSGASATGTAGSNGSNGNNGGGGGGGGSGGGYSNPGGYAGGSGGTYVATDFGIDAGYGAGGSRGSNGPGYPGTQGVVAIKYQYRTISIVTDFLIVAGGGGGGRAGAGGAGGFRTSVGTSGGGATAESPLALARGITYPVTVGAGGIGSSSNATNGGYSKVSIIESCGGGGKGDYTSSSTSTGSTSVGSGDGGAGVDQSGRDGTTGQGYKGGTGKYGNSPAQGGGGGGGGAGAVGSDANTWSGGSGGVGVQNSLSGTATYYAGGGGGGSLYGYGSANGGTGGGGAGGGPTGGNGAGGAGTPNTGGGGGGGRQYDSSFQYGGSGGNGGSGIVILRTSNTETVATTTGSPTVTVSGAYRIYIWTQSGSITF